MSTAELFPGEIAVEDRLPDRTLEHLTRMVLK
jgi:hypothetical protein